MTARVDARAVGRGALVAAVVIVPISLAAELLERGVDDLDDSPWLLLPVLAILATYVAAGAIAGSAVAHAQWLHGALAALTGFAAWLAVRLSVPALQGDDIDFGARAVAVNVVLSVAFGVLGAAFARDHGGGGESARRPRTGTVASGAVYPSEERPDSTGQGAG